MIAITVRILGEILLVLFVCFNKGRRGHDFSRHSLIVVLVEFTRINELLQFALHFHCNLRLRVIVAKNDGRVLRPGVVSLTILGGGIVELVKEADERLVIGFGFIQFNIQDFHEAGRSRANLAIRRIGQWIAGVRGHETNFSGLNGAREFLLEVLDDVLFRAPVATYRYAIQRL